MPREPKIIPNLRYEDPETAVDWLCRAFGFEVHFMAKRADGGIRHAQLRLGHELIMLGPVIEGDGTGLKSPLALPGQSQLICVGIEDVDEHFRRAQLAEAVVITPPSNTDFGARTYMCLDLEGHIWVFGTYWGEPFTDSK